MARSRLLKKEVIVVPQNLDEAAKFLAKIGKEKREIQRIQATLNDEIQKLTQKSMLELQNRQ